MYKRLASVAALSWVVVACASGSADRPAQGAGATPDPVIGGAGAGAIVHIADETWSLPTIACIWGGGTNPLTLAAAEGMIGLDLSKPHLTLRITDDSGAGRYAGEGVVYEVQFTTGALSESAVSRTATSVGGELTVSVAGSRVTAQGMFDDEMTNDVVETFPGSVDADCGQEAPPVTASTPTPMVAADGTITVDGTAFEFTFGSPPRCGIDGGDGHVVGSGHLVDDPNSQVSLSYALAADTPSGEPAMQIVIGSADGTQLWYSAVGYGMDDIGSVKSIAVDGDTVTISGTLADGLDHTKLSSFTAQATCHK